MRPVFCGNFEYDARQSDLERLFRRYGKVDRVDMKSGKSEDLIAISIHFPADGRVSSAFHFLTVTSILF
ncbi:hypothetical protein SASPL_149705 [Salvia splendens]|uniref:RRM domain-containing protein n=1 Tax=Salvia splendens TaxID=180675 RepID=A0A8X8WC56_SALSN|nr:hypothetical protein SASPL_149705 [Salvia splendens]